MKQIRMNDSWIKAVETYVIRESLKANPEAKKFLQEEIIEAN